MGSLRPLQVGVRQAKEPSRLCADPQRTLPVLQHGVHRHLHRQPPALIELASLGKLQYPRAGTNPHATIAGGTQARCRPIQCQQNLPLALAEDADIQSADKPYVALRIRGKRGAAARRHPFRNAEPGYLFISNAVKVTPAYHPQVARAIFRRGRYPGIRQPVRLRKNPHGILIDTSHQAAFHQQPQTPVPVQNNFAHPPVGNIADVGPREILEF